MAGKSKRSSDFLTSAETTNQKHQQLGNRKFAEILAKTLSLERIAKPTVATRFVPRRFSQTRTDCKRNAAFLNVCEITAPFRTYLDSYSQIVFLYALVIQLMVNLDVRPGDRLLGSLLKVKRVKLVGLCGGARH